MVRACFVVLGLLFVASLSTAQPPQPQMPPRDNAQPAPPPATSIIRGRVVAADTGQPLRKAQVRIFAPELRENRLATTDGDGKYEFKEVKAGRYTVNASKGSYVGLAYGQTRAFEPGKPLEISDGQLVEKVDFALPRGAIITGRVIDEFGEPLPDAMVSVQRYQNIGGQKRLVPAGRTAMTNDIGEYRLFAIPPGQYYLQASLRMMGMPADTDDRAGYAPTYFPGTSNMAEAQRVTVRLGQVINDMNMALLSMRTARVTGTAVDSHGRPLTGGIMALPKSDSMLMMFGPPSQIKPDGSFSLGGLTPGDYVLQTNGPPGSDYASMDLTINGDDVTGVRLAAAPPLTVSGRLVVDPAAAQSLQASAIRIAISPAQVGMPMFGFTPPSPVNDDLTFEAKGRPGKMRVVLANPMPGWAIRSVRYRGTDVTDILELRANDSITDVDIELTNRLTDVSGLVTSAKGTKVTDYTVVVFPQDRDKWTVPRYLRLTRPDQDGRYKVNGLPPGDYHLIALDYVDSTDWSDPEFLDGVRTRATPLTIGDGEIKSLDLRLTSGS
jgi:Carboxypeptidase regulatory-like domain